MDGASRGGTPVTSDDVIDAAVVARGTRHTAAAQGVTQFVRFATNVVLARLLTPDAFGIVAIALVVSLLLDQLKDLGTGSALIQRETIDDVLLNSVFYLNLFLGVVLAGGMYFLAGLVASGLGNSDAQRAIQVFAGVTLLTSLSQIHHSLLRRDLRFGVIAVVTTTSAATTAVVSITAALLGAGYWALVVGIAAGAVLDLVLVWVYDRWRPSLTLDLASLRSIWGYSYHLFLSNLLFLFFNQVDKVIVSHFLGAAPLGTYTLAQRTVTSPVTSVGTVVSEVTFPAFARRQNDHAALRSGFVRSSRVVALVTFPAMFGLVALAAPAVAVVFGPRWDGLVPIIWLLAPVAAVQSVTANSSQLLLAKGRTDWSYRWGLVYCVVLTIGELSAVHWGLVGVAAAFACGVLLLTPFGLLLAFHPIQMRLRDYLREMLPHVWITAVMTVATYAAAVVVRANGGASWMQLAAGFVVGVLVYGTLLALVRPPAIEDALITLRRRSTP